MIFFSNRWYINYIYNRFIGNTFLYVGYHLTYLIMDQGYIHNGLGQLYIIKILKAYLETGMKIIQTKVIDELFFLFFINYFIIIFIFYLDIFNEIFIFLFSEFYNYLNVILLISFFFAVPKKKTSTKKTNKDF